MPAGLSPEAAAKASQMRMMLAQLLAPRGPPQQVIPPGGSLPSPGAPQLPSGGFMDMVTPEQQMPNAGASNMSIQPGKKAPR